MRVCSIADSYTAVLVCPLGHMVALASLLANAPSGARGSQVGDAAAETRKQETDQAYSASRH